MLKRRMNILATGFFQAYLDEERVGYGVISGSAVAFNHTHHAALARLL